MVKYYSFLEAEIASIFRVVGVVAGIIRREILC
jgi:hypothetical protein